MVATGSQYWRQRFYCPREALTEALDINFVMRMNDITVKDSLHQLHNDRYVGTRGTTEETGGSTSLEYGQICLCQKKGG